MKAPAVETFPPNVIVLELATPVPPLAAGSGEAVVQLMLVPSVVQKSPLVNVPMPDAFDDPALIQVVPLQNCRTL